ncbi:MAG TPA: aldose 1-epimerase family protein [Oscillospiraceae bacterium]|nr:aldose 1-epimerase family protein [Oscillospiraceae bacterium]HPF55468.1 aldose 1-epimerase family protein [Clostridiales bacterium]HPK34302.1 aldose 1-epimerase family protein [Oscillospiraceae bacterium]HPR76923.1 aldose 1-epimerase family protein [Oscillospiraceae bacterium]
MNYTIQNANLKVEISSLGAELQSIKTADGAEYLYDGSGPWNERAPILFPVVGRLRNNEYTYRGKTYTMDIHGFARKKEFTAKQESDTKVIFTLCNDEDTLTNYPFKFRFDITYELEGGTLSVKFDVKNTGKEEMYFSVGAHEAYCCPLTDDEKFEDYQIIFEKKETANRRLVEKQLFTGDSKPILVNSEALPLNYDDYAVDAIFMSDHTSRKATLIGTKSKKGVEVCFPGFPMLGIWTKPKAYAKYICIEPWYGIGDSVNHNGDLTAKEGIISMEAGKTFTLTHTIRPF